MSMYRQSGRKPYSKELLIKLLSKDSRNRICEYWAGMVKGKEGSHTGGVNLVTHNEFYAGWAPLLEEQCVFISVPELQSIKDLCNAIPWGNNVLGGVEYYLKPECRIAS